MSMGKSEMKMASARKRRVVNALDSDSKVNGLTVEEANKLDKIFIKLGKSAATHASERILTFGPIILRTKVTFMCVGVTGCDWNHNMQPVLLTQILWEYL